MQQVEDFREINRQIEELLVHLAPDELDRTTAFKSWSVQDIVRHLHVWNRAAYLSATSPDSFGKFLTQTSAALRNGDLRTFERGYVGAVSGPELVRTWADFHPRLNDAFDSLDPARRLPWAGPDMSARSMVTARIMESWSHAQAVYDELGIERPSTTAIRNIVVLGRNTYGWTFANRGWPVPGPVPRLILTGPAGEQWTFDDTSSADCIAGSAEEFCQVVTQTRNSADTSLVVSGECARAWMRHAQCFAGPPHDPPAPGTRFRRTRDS